MIRLLLSLLLVLSAATVCPAQPPERLPVGTFSALPPGQLPPGWEPLTFDRIDRHTRYTPVRENGITVIRADSQNASSGLVRKMTIDPAEYPVVRWRWKIENTLPGGNVREKSGDDYPARLYITFAYDPDRLSFFERTRYNAARLLYGEYPPTGAISYIWASNAPAGTMVPNPYTDKVMMFAVKSGTEKAGEWITETRNVYADYQRAFGEKPPEISGVAIMTDTDNTGGSATAFYGNIEFLKQIPD